MKQGALIFDERTDRYDIRFDLADYYGGLHCGQCFDVMVGGRWKPTRIVIFKSRDADNLEQAFKEFTAKKLSREAKPSIRKALSVLREAAGRNVQRAKEKIRERGMER